jgi:hypothetical protein
VRLRQDDHVFEALAADAPQRSFTHRVHQRRLHRGAPDANPGAVGNAIEDRTELIIVIADDELRSLPEGRRVAQLLRGPLLGGRARHRNVDDALGVHVNDEEREDRTEPDVVGLQEVAGPDRVVMEECAPALSVVWSRRPRASHVPLDRSLRDADAELQELAANVELHIPAFM